MVKRRSNLLRRLGLLSPSAMASRCLAFRFRSEEFPEAIVLIRVGDFYEAYGETAKQLAETLGLTLTQRDGIPMSGFPLQIGRVSGSNRADPGRRLLRSLW